MALIDANTCMANLGINSPTSTQTTLFTNLTSYADAAVKSFCNRDFEYQAYPGCVIGGDGDAGYYSGDFQQTIYLRQTPVVSITNLYYDPTGYFGQNPAGAFASNTLLVQGQDYILRYDGCLPGTSTPCSFSGAVQRIGDVWPGDFTRAANMLSVYSEPLPGSIKVQYTAGYPTIPADLTGATYELVAAFYRWMKRGGPVQSEGLGAYNYAMMATMLNTAPEMGSIRGMLIRYRRIPVAGGGA